MRRRNRPSSSCRPFLSRPPEASLRASPGGGSGVDSPPGGPSTPCAGSQPGRGASPSGRAARWPLERPQGAGRGREGQPDTTPRKESSEGLLGPLTHVPPLFPRTLLLPWICAGRPPWKAHFKALRFKQIRVDDSERVGGDRCLQRAPSSVLGRRLARACRKGQAPPGAKGLGESEQKAHSKRLNP